MVSVFSVYGKSLYGRPLETLVVEYCLCDVDVSGLLTAFKEEAIVSSDYRVPGSLPPVRQPGSLRKYGL